MYTVRTSAMIFLSWFLGGERKKGKKIEKELLAREGSVNYTCI